MIFKTTVLHSVTQELINFYAYLQIKLICWLHKSTPKSSHNNEWKRLNAMEQNCWLFCWTNLIAISIVRFKVFLAFVRVGFYRVATGSPRGWASFAWEKYKRNIQSKKSKDELNSMLREKKWKWGGGRSAKGVYYERTIHHRTKA